jgi:hypothetical protein
MTTKFKKAKTSMALAEHHVEPGWQQQAIFPSPVPFTLLSFQTQKHTPMPTKPTLAQRGSVPVKSTCHIWSWLSWQSFWGRIPG